MGTCILIKQVITARWRPSSVQVLIKGTHYLTVPVSRPRDNAVVMGVIN